MTINKQAEEMGEGVISLVSNDTRLESVVGSNETLHGDQGTRNKGRDQRVLQAFKRRCSSCPYLDVFRCR